MIRSERKDGNLEKMIGKGGYFILIFTMIDTEGTVF
jgi:hypothetical protein